MVKVVEIAEELVLVEEHDYFQQSISSNVPFLSSTPSVSICFSHISLHILCEKFYTIQILIDLFLQPSSGNSTGVRSRGNHSRRSPALANSPILIRKYEEIADMRWQQDEQQLRTAQVQNQIAEKSIDMAKEIARLERESASSQMSRIKAEQIYWQEKNRRKEENFKWEKKY